MRVWYRKKIRKEIFIIYKIYADKDPIKMGW